MEPICIGVESDGCRRGTGLKDMNLILVVGETVSEEASRGCND